ncbi:hypothetical protein LAZ67_18001515 [Cordylochernes scorpioides]|uniref:HTH CENPB-type domain-containing protein n=1 Tax=Cordylochernes scorpioides TaxID=51811 RepID=A0ABY6LGR0_9ARAC|nr:hypothetical protein LAZ67_18001515 [Cordylochernes scorpioides]
MPGHRKRRQFKQTDAFTRGMVIGLKRAVKLQILREIEVEKKKKTDVAQKHNIPQSSLSTIIKNSEKIHQQALHAGESSRKRARGSTYADVDEALLQWFKQARSAALPVNGPLLSEKAKTLALEFGLKDFTGSGGWIERWKARHGIKLRNICGESADVNRETMTNWLTDVMPNIISNYACKDIFNADETGLFWRLLPDKTLHFKGETCTGGKAKWEKSPASSKSNMFSPLKDRLFTKPKYDTELYPLFQDIVSHHAETSDEERIHARHRKQVKRPNIKELRKFPTNSTRDKLTGVDLHTVARTKVRKSNSIIKRPSSSLTKCVSYIDYDDINLSKEPRTFGSSRNPYKVIHSDSRSSLFGPSFSEMLDNSESMPSLIKLNSPGNFQTPEARYENLLKKNESSDTTIVQSIPRYSTVSLHQGSFSEEGYYANEDTFGMKTIPSLKYDSRPKNESREKKISFKEIKTPKPPRLIKSSVKQKMDKIEKRGGDNYDYNYANSSYYSDDFNPKNLTRDTPQEDIKSSESSYEDLLSKSYHSNKGVKFSDTRPTKVDEEESHHLYANVQPIKKVEEDEETDSTLMNIKLTSFLQPKKQVTLQKDEVLNTSTQHVFDQFTDHLLVWLIHHSLILAVTKSSPDCPSFCCGDRMIPRHMVQRIHSFYDNIGRRPSPTILKKVSFATRVESKILSSWYPPQKLVAEYFLRASL